MFPHVRAWQRCPAGTRNCSRLVLSNAKFRANNYLSDGLRAVTGKRHASLEAGEGHTGHISTGANEGILFFGSVYPLRLQWLLRAPFSGEKVAIDNIGKLQNLGIAAVDPVKFIDRAHGSKSSVKVTEVLPRLKEGGAFVKFTHDSTESKDEIVKVLDDYLKDNSPKPWWNPFAKIRANVVRGKPWVEDLYRLPTSRVKVEFLPTDPGETPAELTQEQLFSFFRPYGKLLDILPQPYDSKVVPRYALVDFAARRKAIMARNCMHGYIVGEAEGGGKAGTILRLTYEQKVKSHWIRDWIFNHPRIVIPILVALLTGASIAIFDPLRTFSVKAHIERTFDLTNSRVYKWFRSQAKDLFHRRKGNDDTGMDAIWDDRKVNIEQIQTWLMETADTFIIVQGPRGSGKRELVIDQALKHKKNKLVIDCKPIQEARGDSATIRAAAVEVGYRPVFSWMNSISGMIDLAAQGAVGIKTGFSETLDSQLSKIWNTTASALKQIALENKKNDQKDKDMTDDEYLEAHPERRPVVIIDNFLHKAQENSVVYDKIAEWAAGLSTGNIAHVIFLTNDVLFSKSLSKALPDRVFRQISLADCSPEVAKRYVISHINAETEDPSQKGQRKEEDTEEIQKLTPSQRRRDLAELDECINYLGGRLTDLEFFARRIKTGETPKKAVEEMIEQSASEILKMYLFGVDESQRKWTPEQAWMLIKELSKNEILRYNEMLLTDTYKSNGEKALQALEQAELITILSYNGRPRSIIPGKPIYQPAFQHLTEDRVLRSRLDLAILTEQTKVENANIDKYENELKLLSDLSRQPSQIAPRVNWLLGKLASSQAKVEKYEKESALLKSVLQSEF